METHTQNDPSSRKLETICSNTPVLFIVIDLRVSLHNTNIHVWRECYIDSTTLSDNEYY